MQERFQVLALDGGGAKGLFTAHVLAHLEEDLKVNIRDSFDLIAGTSAGGIIALALGAGIPPREIADRYAELIASVFPKRRRLNLPRRIISSTYSGARLEAALESIFQDRTLGDSDKRLVIPSWNARKGGVHLFKTAHHPSLTRDWRLRMVDVAMATSAAPTFFPAASVDKQHFIDGGIWANNPSPVAIAECVRILSQPLETLRVLNIGTPEPALAADARMDNAGVLSWGTRVVSLILAAGTRGGQSLAQHLVGENQYARFDARVEVGPYSIDRVDGKEIASLAATASRKLSPIYTAKFADHVAPVFSPINS